MANDLAVIVPTRGRPENIRRAIAAWDHTKAWDAADMVIVVDDDDPALKQYQGIFFELMRADGALQVMHAGAWQPLVPKLNAAALALANRRRHFALGFAGDDHMPRTIGWAARYVSALSALRTGMVYANDGYQSGKIATEWAVTADAVRLFGAMVPAPVEHLYCDNAMISLFHNARAMAYLPWVLIEHMHPFAGKASTDAQYGRFNSPAQYDRDQAAYEGWCRNDLPEQLRMLQRLRETGER